eukprot:1379410-Lingulodinium_polyedra.AAC.1
MRASPRVPLPAPGFPGLAQAIRGEVKRPQRGRKVAQQRPLLATLPRCLRNGPSGLRRQRGS